MTSPPGSRLALLLALALPALAGAERLPIETYTSADGLSNDTVYRVVVDSLGFVWFCTREGLSRFDGHGFITYDIEHGLPSPSVHDLLETRDGVYWVATRAGLARFEPLGPHAGEMAGDESSDAPLFTAYLSGGGPRAAQVSTLLEDRAGVVWVGTAAGLYRLREHESGQARLVQVDLGIADRLDARAVSALAEDASGALWVGTASGLRRRLPDGQTEHYTGVDGIPLATVQSLLIDRRGRLWVGTRGSGLVRLTLDPRSHRFTGARLYTTTDGLPTNWINDILEASDGVLWAGSNRGLLRLRPTADAGDLRVSAYGVAQGLLYPEIADVAEDRNGDLWTGALLGGAARVSLGGLTIFGATDGLEPINSLLETNRGELIAIGRPAKDSRGLHRFTGDGFVSIRVPFPPDAGAWGWNQTALIDHTGDWWFASRAGVLRFAAVSRVEELARARPKAVYTTRQGLAADVVLRLFEDSRGDVWIGTVGEGHRPSGLARWERSSGIIHSYYESDGLPELDVVYVSALTEDRGGNVWAGFSGDGGLARRRGDRFERWNVRREGAAGPIRNLLLDSQGRLWVATYHGGLGRCDDPQAEIPTFSRYTTADGLASNEVYGFVEDRFGHIFVGTARGIDRLDPQTGRIRRVSIRRGLPVGEVAGTLRDSGGALWFNYATGLVRLLPNPLSPLPPAQARITGVRVAGRRLSLSALGQTEVGPLELPPQHNSVEVDFVAPGSGPDEAFAYQLRLVGVDGEWSVPSDRRSVHYASLSPGTYRLLVRAVNREGVAGNAAASLAFTIHPPVWLRWWFLAVAALALAAVGTALYRYRVGRLLEVANLRTRIATDLHDDIGANLTRIAVLSEVVRQESTVSGSSADRLVSIATLARESVAGLADIVWAIHPGRDRLQDVTRRMREHAEDLFARGDVELRFDAAEGEEARRVSVGLRRDLLLIFKEAIHNAARHSGCSRIDVAIRTDGARLALLVRDDGIGFDPAAAANGHGLSSMRRRAERLHARLELDSRPGAGTIVRLEVALHPASLAR